MGRDEVHLDPGRLEAFIAEVFGGAGMGSGGAGISARCVVQTSLWGKDSHGVMRVPHYVRRLLNGALNPRPELRVVGGTAAMQVIDGDNGPGFVVAHEAMRRAVGLAESYDVGVVGVRNSNHFGAAALYARQAVDRDMIGIAMTNVAPRMVAPGGARAITGNNPLAVGAPTYGDFPFVLDLSLSAVAGGKLLLARERNERIPTDWALDTLGRPTDDPAAAFAGLWLPLGGVKGLGLSYAVDVLSGLITGAAFGLRMKSQFADVAEPSGTGHMMIALNVEAIMPREELKARMAEFCSAIKSSPMRDVGAEMLIPGERAHRTERERRSTGIPVSPKLHQELRDLGAELGVPADSLLQ